MKRKIIKIDEEKCNGCGLCVKGCPEGALQIIDGKARLVGELLCDGLGACLGECPAGAMTIEERDVEAYDESKVMENVVKGGVEVIAAHLKHLKDHGQEEYLSQAIDYLKAKSIDIPVYEKEVSMSSGGCPGMAMRDFSTDAPNVVSGSAGPSQLRQWPIQLALLNPAAPYFKDADIVVAADCVPFTYPDFHQRFLKGKVLIIFCPKLDETIDAYREKLKAIISENNIKSVTMLHMEVPCCTGVVRLVEEAVLASGKNIILKDYTISIKGEIL